MEMQHPGKKPHETILVEYGPQILWPDHCVRATRGAEFHKDLHVPHAGLVMSMDQGPLRAKALKDWASFAQPPRP